MTEDQHRSLMLHLFPDDGCEAVAIALCGRADAMKWNRQRLLVRRIELIPYSSCSIRRPDQVTWPTNLLLPMLAEAEKNNWSVVKLHGHRFFDQFSDIDDRSDRQLFPSLYGWVNSNVSHASAILMDDGRVFGRIVSDTGSFDHLDCVSVVGDNITVYPYGSDKSQISIADHATRIAQTFGEGTYRKLRSLRIAVVGCSGTGSPVIEQLARNCVGSLVLVDPDHVEAKNLNRILNTTMADAKSGTSKVEVARRSIEAMELGTEVLTFEKSLFDPEVVRAVAGCDLVFGCMDTIDGRFLLNKLASFYLLPYIDLGVKIEADGRGGVQQVCGTVHYLKPGGASLLSRNTFTLEQVRSAGIRRNSPSEYSKLLEEGYIRGVQEDRPAVIQLNSLIASLGVSELLARLHPYRLDPNREFAVHRLSLSHGIFDHEAEGAPCTMLSRHVGRGDTSPLLDSPELGG